ncbi:Uncharacterised protein [Streptococcus sobrinus]|nr:Uncharacterised protein [Streptococcus sobrinus]
MFKALMTTNQLLQQTLKATSEERNAILYSLRGPVLAS